MIKVTSIRFHEIDIDLDAVEEALNQVVLPKSIQEYEDIFAVVIIRPRNDFKREIYEINSGLYIGLVIEYQKAYDSNDLVGLCKTEFQEYLYSDPVIEKRISEFEEE